MAGVPRLDLLGWFGGDRGEGVERSPPHPKFSRRVGEDVGRSKEGPHIIPPAGSPWLVTGGR